MKVEFYRHSIEDEDIREVEKVLRSLFLTTGPATSEFEQRFSNYTHLKETVGLNSCTAALHLSLLGLGIGPGDEVITTPLTFIATATAILHAGARPVFVDVDAETGLINPGRIEEAVTASTKAILPVHLYGTMADMKALRRIADRRNLKIIEDCAHCIEGERDGIRPGQLGDAACFSFYATKNLTSGEGGALATNDPDLAERVRILRLHGMSRDAASRYRGDYEHWDMLLPGWKYNMDSIHAALLINQVNRLDDYWKRRASLWKKYTEGLIQIPGLSLPAVIGKSACHLFTIWVAPHTRDRILKGLQECGIGVAVNYRAIHTLKYFQETYGFKLADFPEAEKIGRMTVSLPFYPKMSNADIQYVIECVGEVIDKEGLAEQRFPFGLST
jgi:dTDP-4-amino-4,6-dideoxygalactose transaminase